VRSLLGIPDGEGGGRAFSPTLPPVGFKYASDAFAGRPYPTTQRPTSAVAHSALGSEAWNELGPQDIAGESGLTQDTAQRRGAVPELGQEQIENRLRQEVSPAGAPEGPQMEALGASKVSLHHTAGKETVQNEFLIKGTVQQRDAATGSKQEPAKKATHPGARIERASLEIPGVSEKSQSFPALAPAKKDDAPAGRTASRPRQRVSPASAREDFVRASRSEESQLAQDRSVTRPPVTERQGAGVHFPVQQESAPATNAAPGPVHVSERLQEAGQVKTRLVTVPPLRPNPAMAEVKVAGSARPNVVNRSNAEAADTIAQLRHAVQRLTAKVASQPTRMERETMQQPLPAPPRPPVQPVVIVQRPSTRTPRAFWERSYLGRLRLRTLR